MHELEKNGKKSDYLNYSVEQVYGLKTVLMGHRNKKFTLTSMVFIVDGNVEIGAHLRSNLRYFILFKASFA